MRFHWVSVVLGATLGIAVLWPGRAAACSCIPDAFARMNPEPGAEDVAVNHAVTVIGFFDPKSLELTTADGKAVPFELDSGPSPGCKGGMFAELIPKDGYAANTEYRVRAEPKYPESAMNEFTFTTGDWGWAEREDLPPLQAKVSVVTGYPPLGVGCSSGSVMSCSTLNDFENVEVIARKDGEIILRWILLANDPNFLFKAVPDCLEFRRREPTGARSKPLEFCGEALNVRPYDEAEVRDRESYCQDGQVGGGAHVRPNAHAADEDAGVDPEGAMLDGSSSNASSSGEAGSRSTQPSAFASRASNGDASHSEQRKYGCAAAPAQRAPSVFASGLLLLAGLTLVRRRKAIAR